MLQEHHALHRQVESHADGVGCHHHFGVAFAEAPRLGLAHGMGERPVHHAAGVARVVELRRRGVDVAF